MAKELKSSSDTNREQIELHLVSEEGTVPLTDKQKVLLQRWIYADELIRAGETRKREDLAQMIVNRWNVSRTTAFQDIVNAELVFASSTPLNKKYRTQLRIEYLETKIDELFEQREFIAAAMFEKTLQKYYEKYPDITPPRSPKTIVFNIQNNALPAAPMTAEDAMRAAGKLIDIKPKDPDAGTTN